MSNNKFHKILSDTITLPLLPADKFNETNTGYYAVLEKNYIPITSDIECIYKPDWITGYELECEKDSETNETLKYYNKLVIKSISDNETKKLRKDVMEFAVRNNVNSLTPINHIYAKVSLIPKEDINVNLEFIPTEKLRKNGLSENGGIISGDELKIHINYWAKLNDIYLSNITLKLNNNLLDKDKIKSLRINKINSSDNKVIVDLVYLIDENIDIDNKSLKFEAIFKTQYNKVNKQKTITLKVNTYKITLEIDNPDHIVFNGDNRILTYKCTYTDGINNTPKDVKDYVLLEFSYVKDQNELKYNVIKTIYDTKSKTFKTTINVYENYTSEERQLNVKAVYNGSKKIESDPPILITQDNANISLLYYVEYLDRNKVESPSTNGIYEVSAFGETIRLHYYGIIVIDEKNSVKIASVTNTKNNITTTYKIDVLVDKNVYNNVTLNDDEYILDINFDRNESTSITKDIKFNMNNISSALCKLTLDVLSIDLAINQDKCTNIIGGIPEYNNIILAFRAYDSEKRITIEDVNLYSITCNNDDVNLLDIQYEIITYKNINYVVASNIRCKDIYDKKEDRHLKFTVKYNSKTVSHVVTLKSVVYACEIRPRSNYVSALGEDRFEVISVGIIKDGYLDKHLETAVDDVKFTYTNNDSQPNYIKVIQNNRKLVNKSLSIIRVEPLVMSGEHITTTKDIVFRIKVKYKDSDSYYDIKQLYLLIYVELYKERSYSTSLVYDSSELNISPFINNILYYKCYVCEIETDGSLKKVDISKFLKPSFSIISDDWVAVLAYVDKNPTYNKEDYTYRGKITIPRYICPAEVSYQFKYELSYSNINTKLSIYKQLNIYKPEVRTCTDNINPNPLNETYIQYRSNNDASSNDNKSILKIGTDDKRISSKGCQVTLYYRVVFKIYLQNNANYIYDDDYKTYIDLDKTHFISFVDTSNITVDKEAFSKAEKESYDSSDYLKIQFTVNKNDGLSKLDIYKSIKYEFISDNINGTDYHYNLNAFTNDLNNDNNRIEIYLDGASLDLVAFFDSSNSGTITDDSSSEIIYSAYPLLNLNLHVRVLLNDELQPTYSSYFKFTSDSSTFLINDGILDSGLNTYKSEYNLDDLYIEPDNKTYTLYYCYNGIDEDNTKTNDLTVIRTSFGRDEKCELIANISKTEISNNGDTVKITFYLQYNNGEIIDLGEGAIKKFNYDLITNISTQLIPGKTINVTYDSESKKYSFDYEIDDNPTTEGKTYTFSIQFGDDDEKHKKELICTLSKSTYKLVASSDPETTLTALDPGAITITCYMKKDNKNIYTNVVKDKFSIVQTKGNILNKDEYVEEFTNGVYSKKYNVPDNKTKDSITYEFKCSYNLNETEYPADVSIILSGATFDVSIFDSETDLSKQNIVNPVGEIKTINYFGRINGKNVTENVEFKNETVGDGLGLMKEEEVTSDNENKILSIKYKFGLNKTANTITYKFTVTYQDISKSISFTQKPGDIKLILKNEPDPIPKSGGLCKIIYYGYVGTDPNIKENHITTDFLEPKSTEVDGFKSYTPTKVSGPTVTDYLIEYVFSVPARAEDNNIDKIFKRNWTVIYKNGDIEKTKDKDIVQNGDATFFPAFDIFGLKYLWEGGHDLDTVTLLTRSDNGTLLVNKSYNDDTEKVDLCTLSMGYSQPIPSIYKTDNYNKVSYPCLSYINFSGDNTQDCGYESVAVNFRKILLDFLLNKKDINLKFDIWMTWFGGSIWDGKVNIYFETFKGDNITFGIDDLNHIDFNTEPFNPAICRIYKINGTLTNENHSSIMKTTIVKGHGGSDRAKDFKNKYAKVGQLLYNTKNKTAILTVNPIANGDGSVTYYSTHIKIHVSLKENSYVDHKYSSITSYGLILINNVVNNIDNEISIRLEGLYRKNETSNIENFGFTYVNSNINSIMMYIDPPTEKVRKSKQLDSKYYNNISNNIYNATNRSNNTLLYPSINLNNINQKLPGIDSSITYYGFSLLYINYNYKYTVPGSEETKLSISRIIKL